MNYYSPSGYSMLSPIVKKLILANVVMFVIDIVAGNMGLNLSDFLGLHSTFSHEFRPMQLVTYMFMHGGIDHILFNMLALWMFGNNLENFWGSKRFLTYYLITGVGAGVVQLVVTYIRVKAIDLPADVVQNVINEGWQLLREGKTWRNPQLAELNAIINTSTVGASGAIFGLLLAFGMMFPNLEIYIYFLFPIKAKWFVLGYGALELFEGIRNSAGDNVAHFAHLGGMIFGYVLIKYWRKKGTSL